MSDMEERRGILALEIELVANTLRGLSPDERKASVHLINRLSRLIEEMGKLGVHMTEPAFD